MRGKIFLYLFLFTLLILIFQYVNSTRILDSKDERIEHLESELELSKMASDSLVGENLHLQYFSLLNNENAISYFEDQGLDADEIARSVENQLIEMNMAEQNHPLVPFDGIRGPMRINKIKPLNHRWVIADFTDGTYWGEVLLSYYVEEDGSIDFVVEKSFLYPAQ